jgi:uncharacterized membrane protein
VIEAAVWQVIGGYVYALCSVLFALYFICALLVLVLGGSGWESFSVFRRRGVMRRLDSGNDMTPLEDL